MQREIKFVTYHYGELKINPINTIQYCQRYTDRSRHYIAVSVILFATYLYGNICVVEDSVD
jgi:hypothetical protein